MVECQIRNLDKGVGAEGVHHLAPRLLVQERLLPQRLTRENILVLSEQSRADRRVVVAR